MSGQTILVGAPVRPGPDGLLFASDRESRKRRHAFDSDRIWSHNRNQTLETEPRMKHGSNTEGVTVQRELRIKTVRRTGRAKLLLSPIFAAPFPFRVPSVAENSGSLCGNGSTGDPPVPVGDSPNGRARPPLPKGLSLLVPGALPVPPGESPGETGQWPTALELGESTALFSLSSDGGGGEGRGEESRFYRISPLPNPLPARSSRGEGDRRSTFQCLIQWQWASGLCYPKTNFRARS